MPKDADPSADPAIQPHPSPLSDSVSEIPVAEPPPRLVSLGAQRRVQVIGNDQTKFGDLYHRMLTVSWRRFILLASGVYVILNALFAVLYLLDWRGVANMHPWSITDAFFFSVQTFGTIGYGVMSPKDLFVNLVTTGESFVGLGAVAVATGIIFARVSRPTARVMFSRVAVITEYDGVPTLIFRAANQRANQIMEAEVTVFVARQVTTREGMRVRKLEDLKVTRSRSPMFALTWMIMHPITEESPLFGATAESLRAEWLEIVVVLAGIDDTFAQRIHARHSYIPPEIIWDRKFADVLILGEDGQRMVDYTRFHDLVEPDEAADAR